MTKPKAKVAIAKKAIKKAATRTIKVPAKKVVKPIHLKLDETNKEAPAMEVVIHDETLFEHFVEWLKSL